MVLSSHIWQQIRIICSPVSASVLHGTICSATSSLNYSSAFPIKSSTARLEGRLGDMQEHSFTVSAVTIKIGPWGPELIWQLATKYKMSRHQRHLQYVIIYTMTNEGGVSIFGMYVSQKVQNVIFLKIHNFKNDICRCIIFFL